MIWQLCVSVAVVYLMYREHLHTKSARIQMDWMTTVENRLHLSSALMEYHEKALDELCGEGWRK